MFFEYGVQSLPSYSTLAQVYSMPDDADLFGQLHMHRQHHEHGNEQILNEIQNNLMLPNLTEPVKNLKALIYLSQLNQAMTYKTATEMFRRSRGANHCMGAMYWQLNDLWQAPTWSSIEYMSAAGMSKGGKWKMSHYFVRNAYAQVLLSPVINKNQLDIFAISDLNVHLESDFNLKVYNFKSFELKHDSKHAFAIEALSSKLVLTLRLDAVASACQLANKCFIQIDSEHRIVQEGAKNFLFLDNKLRAADLNVANIKVQLIERLDSRLFSIILETDAIALFVNLDMNTTQFYGVFSDNGFHMTQRLQMVTYKAQSPIEVTDIKENLVVTSFADIYV